MPAIAYQTETSARDYPFSATDVADLQEALECLRASGKPYGLEDLEALVAKLPAEGGEVWIESLFELVTIPRAARDVPDGDPAGARLEALWERHLSVRDARLQENPAGVNELCWLMSEISELTEHTSWSDNTPSTCWSLIEGTSDRAGKVPKEHVRELRRLVTETGGIWVWPSDGGSSDSWQAPGPLFVPLAEWRAHLALATWEEQLTNQVRWTKEAFGVGPDECRLNVHVRPRGATR